MFTLNQLKSIWTQMLQAGPIPPQILKLSPEELKQQFEQTSDTINSLVALLIGFCFFCALALSAPDTQLLSTDPSIQLPFVQGLISFRLFLVIAPLTLFILSLYVHIYVGHWWRLLRALTQQALDAGLQPPPILQPPLVFNLPTKTAAAASSFLLYFLVPLTLFFFCHEALKLPQTPSARYGVIEVVSSIRNGPHHSLSLASFVIPLSSIAAIYFAFLFGRRVVEPHTHDCKRTASAYRYLLPFIASVGFAFLIIALVWPQYLWKLPLNLNKADLKDHNLSYLDLTGAMLWNANLQGANLSGAKLDGAYLELSKLTSATLTNASLQGADLTDVDFTDADLTNANLCATYSVRARFPDRAKRTGIHWEYANLTDTNLKEADVAGLTPTGQAPCFTDAPGQPCGTDFVQECQKKPGAPP